MDDESLPPRRPRDLHQGSAGQLRPGRRAARAGPRPLPRRGAAGRTARRRSRARRRIGAEHPPGAARRAVRRPARPGSVRCVACAHRCVLRPGRIGICGVRQNRGGWLYTLVYGQARGRRKPSRSRRSPSTTSCPGSYAYSVATQGCNFHCAFCQNWADLAGPSRGCRAGEPPRHARARWSRRRSRPAFEASPTRTSSRRSSSSSRSTRWFGRGRPACTTSSSRTATRPPRRSSWSRRTWTPRTSISRPPTTGSTDASAAPAGSRSATRSWRCGGAASGWS